MGNKKKPKKQVEAQNKNQQNKACDSIRSCVHQTLAPDTPSSPGMPTSPYEHHNMLHSVSCSLHFVSSEETHEKYPKFSAVR